MQVADEGKQLLYGGVIAIALLAVAAWAALAVMVAALPLVVLLAYG